MNKEEIQKVINEKGIEWLIAAMVEGSIGYHTPKHARILIGRALEGAEKDFCERCDACFGTDLMAMMDYDISLFRRKEERDPGFVKRLMAAMKKVEGWSDESQLSVSLAYPTMNI